MYLFFIKEFGKNYITVYSIHYVCHSVFCDYRWEYCCSVAKSCLTLCDPMDCSMPGLPVRSPSPRFCPSSCPLNRWCYPTILSSATLFSFCLQSFPASGSFPKSQVFESGGQSTGASPSILPMNIQDWFPLELTIWICLQSKGLSRVFSSTTIWKH